MADLVVRVGSRTAQGVRMNNEDRFVVDMPRKLFLVADGMGGQDRGEVASGMAAEIIPQVVGECLAANQSASRALTRALEQANEAIIDASRGQPEGRRMGTTAVVALHAQDKVFVTNFGDSRAYLIRGDDINQLTIDHSVAQALVISGALTPEEARHSPYQHVLHKFLGGTALSEEADIVPFTPQANDRLLLASDGLTNHIIDEDLRQGRRHHPNPQDWADYLVQTALERGSRDNVTCVVIDFDPA